MQKGPSKLPIVTRWDLWLAGAGFCVVLAVGLALSFADAIVGWVRQHAVIASALGGAACYALWREWKVRALLRALGDRVGVGEAKSLSSPWVIDGDTIDDRARKVRYRLANIDAPETGANAKCLNERRKGDRARAVAIGLVRGAKIVSVRPTWRKDLHGRRVAYVLIDGKDLGEILLAQGLAWPWRGKRLAWCGPNGPLSKIAAARGEVFACAACAHWRSAKKP